jgi:hypothetical protein
MAYLPWGLHLLHANLSKGGRDCRRHQQLRVVAQLEVVSPQAMDVVLR